MAGPGPRRGAATGFDFRVPIITKNSRARAPSPRWRMDS